MLHVIWHALLDSLKVFIFAFVLYFILSFFKDKISNLLKKHKKTSPIISSFAGLIPQCGISVMASDLYINKHISMGCIIAVFFACSDEALPILFTSDKYLFGILLLIIKFIGGFVIGFIVDFFVRREKEPIQNTLTYNHCAHKKKVHHYLIHPLIHALNIFAYVFVVNLIFGIIIYCVGEERIIDFLLNNEALSPLLCTIVGLIPNCASSVLITELFVIGGIPFGALLAGLCVNAGLGLIYLFKNKSNAKDFVYIFTILFMSSLIFGYATMLIERIL